MYGAFSPIVPDSDSVQNNGKLCWTDLGYAERFIASINADSVFFSCKGLSENGILTDVSESEISIREVMRSHADHSYFLCDGSKLGAKYAFTLCHAREITEILCDVPLPHFE